MQDKVTVLLKNNFKKVIKEYVSICHLKNDEF